MRVCWTEWNVIRETQKFSALSSLTVTFKISSFGQEPVNGAPAFGVNWIHRWQIDLGEPSELAESLSASEILKTFDVIPWIQEWGTFSL